MCTIWEMAETIRAEERKSRELAESPHAIAPAPPSAGRGETSTPTDRLHAIRYPLRIIQAGFSRLARAARGATRY